jgi:transcriptional regulator
MYQEVARMRNAGLAQMEIARQIGRTHQQVSKIVQFLTRQP